MNQRIMRILAISLALSSGATYAQEAGLEEITVTAERREQSLQEVPLAVTAFTGDMVTQGGITSLEDVALQTPNFKMTSFNITEPQLFIRGIGDTNDSIGVDSAIAVFIDDVYIGRPSGGSTDLYDLDRIEVLRGPQGTLYGRNAAGGAINIFTKKPQHEFEAKAGVTVGSDSLFNVRGYVNGSISETVAGKLTVNLRQRDGFSQNITTGQELDDDDTTSIRGQLLITPSDTVDVLLGFDYTDIDTSGVNRFMTNFDVIPFPAIWVDPHLAEIATFGGDPRKSSHDENQVSEKELLGFLARVDADLGWATLTSITAYREDESAWHQALVPLLSTDNGGQGLYEVDDGANQDAEQVSQEFRLAGGSDRTDWVAGLYYFKEEVDKNERFVTYWDPISPGILPSASPGDVSFIQSGETKSFAAFGQVTWDMNDVLALTFGARYTDDEKELNNAAVTNITPPGPFTGIPLVGPPYATSASDSWDDITLRASVDWDITDEHMLYFTYSEGFKSGAFNGSQGNAILAATPISPEEATNYEIGARTEWLDGRARFNITFFDLEYDNLQTYTLNANLELVADNASAEVDGIETDFAFAFTENFSLSGTFATMDGKFTDGANAGNDLRRAPDQTWSLSANLDVPFDSGAHLDLSAGASYTDEFHFEIDNDPRGLESDVTLVNASAMFVSADGDWDITLWGKNLSDELYSVHHIDGTLGGATRIYAPPRTYGVSFTKSWN